MATLQTPEPTTLAVHGEEPSDMLMAACTSEPSMVPNGADKSQALVCAEMDIEKKKPVLNATKQALRIRKVLLGRQSHVNRSLGDDA